MPSLHARSVVSQLSRGVTDIAARLDFGLWTWVTFPKFCPYSIGCIRNEAFIRQNRTERRLLPDECGVPALLTQRTYVFLSKRIRRTALQYLFKGCQRLFAFLLLIQSDPQV